VNEPLQFLPMVLALAAGIGVAAACGLRAFLPLLILGIAGRLGYAELHPGVHWLSSNPALLALGVATVLEVLADKVPVVDHALDGIATFLRPAAGFLASFALLARWPEPWGPFLALVLGSGTLALHALKSKVRLGSTLTTLGIGNPVLSVLEDFTVAGLVIAAVLVPLLMLLVLIAIMVFLLRRRPREAPRPEGDLPA